MGFPVSWARDILYSAWPLRRSRIQGSRSCRFRTTLVLPSALNLPPFWTPIRFDDLRRSPDSSSIYVRSILTGNNSRSASIASPLRLSAGIPVSTPSWMLLSASIPIIFGGACPSFIRKRAGSTTLSSSFPRVNTSRGSSTGTEPLRARRRDCLCTLRPPFTHFANGDGFSYPRFCSSRRAS